MTNNQIKFAIKYFLKCIFIFLLPLILLLLPGCNTNSSVGSIAVQATDEKPVEISDNIKEESIEVVVVIDAGHGGDDWGTYYGSTREKDINLDIALKLGPLLQEKGIKIVYTREKDEFISLIDRAETANNLNATLFISIHNNKMPNNSKYRGTETLYAATSNSRFDTMSDKRLAQIVQNELVQNLKTSDKGIIYRPELAVIRRTKMPAVIAEIGYISNSSDRERLDSMEFRKKTAESLCSAVVKALEEMGATKDSNAKWMVMQKN